jgi:putative phosphoesterase
VTHGPTPSGAPVKVGLVADTHGFLPTAAEAVFAGVDAIIHAGDIGEGYVLDLLEAIAPVIAVRGNNRYVAEGPFPVTRTALVGGITIAVVHRVHDFPGGHAPSAARVVVYGHTHRPSVEERDGALWVNPGSPSEPRALPDGSKRPTVGILTIAPSGEVSAEIVTVD